MPALSSCAGAWACVAVLLKGDGNQNNYEPSMIGLSASNAGTLSFLGTEPRVAVKREGSPAVANGPQRPDCVAGHIGFEPANPSASYLIGIT
jgi:hypothetical protein